VAGLAGIFAGWEDGDLNFAHLTEGDAERATRYALNEMNGFAPWLHELASAQPRAVQSVLRKCIDAEWELPPGESASAHLVMFDLAWSGNGINVLLRDDLVERLKHGDPANFDILRYAVAVLMHPEPPDRAAIAAIAAARVEALAVADRHFTFWAMLGVQLDATPAIECLERRLATADEKDAENVMVQICARLSGEPSDQPQVLARQSWLSPDAFLKFAPLVFTYLRADHDIHREGGYTPGARDYAQRFRDTMLGRFSADADVHVELVIEELLKLPVMARWRDYMRHLLDKHREQVGAASRWTAADVRTFAREHEREARFDIDLFRIGVRRLKDLKNWVECGEDSPRDEVDPAKNELGFRRWLQRRLNDRSRGRYLIPQEWEIDGGERPDLRLSVPGIAPVSLELKIAEKWTLQQLLDGLEIQLVGRYMRDVRARYGIYVLGLFAAKRTWRAADGITRLAIGEVVQRLREQANEIIKTRGDVLGLEVVHIDFSPPAK
jgi:hypothetical protein